MDEGDGSENTRKSNTQKCWIFRDDPYDSVGVQPLTTEEAVDIAMMAPFS